jgi:chemotaxis protein MotB
VSLFYKRGGQEEVDIWPGFVDALSTVLLVFIFVLVGFIASQIYLSRVILDKDTTLSDLKTRFSSVCTLLNKEKDKNAELVTKNDDLSKRIEDLNEAIETLQAMFQKEVALRKDENAEKATLLEKIEVVTNQLKDVMVALDAAHKDADEQKQAMDRIRRENLKLNELTKINAYRSEFFDKMQVIVDGREGIKIVGDRFVFQSELFFDSASDELSPEGARQVSELASVIKELGEKIPKQIRWILRVDGHTDNRPITGGRFQSNWELSAARAISVVKYLIKQGVEPQHLVAAGFGENQPLATGKTGDDLAKNRRIEFKLDER